jgi:hypothetical protein
VNVNQSELDALIVRGHLTKEERGDGAAIKKAIEAVLSDLEFDVVLFCQARECARLAA